MALITYCKAQLGVLISRQSLSIDRIQFVMQINKIRFVFDTQTIFLDYFGGKGIAGKQYLLCT